MIELLWWALESTRVNLLFTVPRPFLQAPLREAVVPIQLFVFLIQQSNAISMLSLAICCPTPLPAKPKDLSSPGCTEL